MFFCKSAVFDHGATVRPPTRQDEWTEQLSSVRGVGALEELALQSDRRQSRSLLRFPARLLTGERQQQQHGQVPQAAEEQLAGAAAVALAVEAEGQVADEQVDGQGDEGEGPGGEVQHGG